jgi:hypothetical protein
MGEQDISRAVYDAIQSADPERMVTKTMVVFESIRSDGARSVAVVCSPDTRTWDVIGLAEYASQTARYHINDELRRSGQ